MTEENLIIRAGEKQFNALIKRDGETLKLALNGKEIDCQMEKLSPGTVSMLMEGKSYLFQVNPTEVGWTMEWNRGEINVEVEDERIRLLKQFAGSASGVKGSAKVKAPMPGLVVKIIAAEGQAVKKGYPLLVVEAMKMENEITASRSGFVKEIKVKERQAVEKNEVLVVLEAED